ncbi:MAG: DbpA RNA binding domain-containing protein [Spirochaetaceae bacterium]
MSKKNQEFSTLNENLGPSIKAIIESIKSSLDLDTIVSYKKIVKKNVPLHLRSYLTAFLLKEYLNNKPRKRSVKKEGEKSLFINIGKNRRVYPSDLIQLVSKTAEIEKENIGNIKILDNYSFVNVAGDYAEKVVSSLDSTEYRGRKLTVNYAKKDI